jgi:hypothetical protein
MDTLKLCIETPLHEILDGGENLPITFNCVARNLIILIFKEIVKDIKFIKHGVIMLLPFLRLS